MAKVNQIPNTGKRKAGVPQEQKKRVVMVRMILMILVDLICAGTLCTIAGDGLVELSFRENLLIPTTVVFGVLALAAAVYQVIVIVKKIDTGRHYVTPAMLLCVTVFALVSCLVYWLQGTITLMTIAIASMVATALFVVYCLYMHIFYR